MNWINKNWKYFTTAIFVLLCVCIFFLIRSEKRLKEAVVIAKANKEYYEKTAKNLTIKIDELKASNDTLLQEIKNSKVIIINKETKYETVKKSPINTKYTSAELNEWVRGLESEARKLKSTNK